MSKLSQNSKNELATCHADLQRLFNHIAEIQNIAILEGKRSKERQLELFKSGKSKRKEGKHNTDPLSEAADVAPLPIDWNDTKKFYAFGELVIREAGKLNIKIRWGGDWDGDGDYKDQTFNDLVHFELIS